LDAEDNYPLNNAFRIQLLALVSELNYSVIGL